MRWRWSRARTGTPDAGMRGNVVNCSGSSPARNAAMTLKWARLLERPRYQTLRPGSRGSLTDCGRSGLLPRLKFEQPKSCDLVGNKNVEEATTERTEDGFGLVHAACYPDDLRD